MQTPNASRTLPVGDALIAASRQVWLAGLGAAVVTRDWAGKEARPLLRTLVREGTVVESRAIRFVGNRVETSMTRANALLGRTRSTLQSAVKAYADPLAVMVRTTLPRALPALDLVARLRAARPAAVDRARPSTRAKTRVRNAKTVKVVAKRAAKPAKRPAAKRAARTRRG